jgi:2-polyprenyl-6-methoxyphenol hydroxylase-like FAD-dependent oxidoreductase
MTGKGISVALVGGGIGGLAAALSLLRVGIDAHVYEQAGALTEVGGRTLASRVAPPTVASYARIA